jgi:hypothetical protein
MFSLLALSFAHCKQKNGRCRDQFPEPVVLRIATADNEHAEENRGHPEMAKGEIPMINPISTSGMQGVAPKAEARAEVKVEKTLVRSEEAPAKLETPIKDSVQLSPVAQARLLRRAGQSIPQIALKLGLAIPTVAAFFEE